MARTPAATKTSPSIQVSRAFLLIGLRVAKSMAPGMSQLVKGFGRRRFALRVVPDRGRRSKACYENDPVRGWRHVGWAFGSRMTR